jgi:RNA polymerase sigma-70 factor (ECF subfamily)
MSLNQMYHQTSTVLEEEHQLIRRAQKDPEQFGPLYTKYHEQIFRYVHQRMDDQDLAFDVTSQVFMKALKNIEKYEYRGVPLASWLYRIAKSELNQAFRDRKAKRTVNVNTEHLSGMIDEMEEEGNDERRKILFDALKTLSETDLQLIEMRYFEKRSYKEMGEIIDLTENNAKVKTFRALDKLKKHIKR